MSNLVTLVVMVVMMMPFPLAAAICCSLLQCPQLLNSLAPLLQGTVIDILQQHYDVREDKVHG